ncbi:MAG: hypothetical protein FWC97_06900 [Treponema sp.]|nr:hypothetical protein [Treponema sp.]
MAGKISTKRLFFVLTLFFIAIPGLSGQADSFFIENRFVQRLIWSGDSFAMRFEVIIEKEESGLFQRIHQIHTTEFQIDLSLPPGSYRYRVIPFDYLGRPGAGTEWINFEVLPAINPELISFWPESDLSNIRVPVILEEYVLIIYGNNISPSAEIFLRVFGGAVIFPSDVQISQDRTWARLVFDNPYSMPEFFEIIVRNPGGLESSIIARTHIPLPPGLSREDILLQLQQEQLNQDVPPQIDNVTLHDDSGESFYEVVQIVETANVVEAAEVVNQNITLPELRYRSVDLYLALAFTPLFSTFGNLNFLPDTTAIFSGAAIKFGFVRNTENNFIGWGMEAAFSMFSFAVNQTVMLDTNLFLQKRLPNERTQLALRYRIGIGFTSGALNNLSWQTNIGLSFLWFTGRSFYMDAGADLVYWTDESGALRPFIGMGWKF